MPRQALSITMQRFIKFLKHPKVISAYMLLTFVFVVYYIYAYWQKVAPILATMDYGFLLYAFLFGCLNLLSYGYVGYLLYRELGATISFWDTVKIIMASRVGIYIPGRIWYASNFYIFSRKLNLPPLIIGQSFVLTNVFLFVTGGICSLPVIFPFIPTRQKLLLISIGLLLIMMSHPGFVRYLVSFFPKLSEHANKNANFLRFSSRVYFKFVAYFFVLWVIAGIRLYFCVAALVPIEYGAFPTILAANSASLILGILAVFAPGGIGVREGVGVFVLSAIILAETAVVVMLISRLLTAITDLGSGVIAFRLLNRVKMEEKGIQENQNCQGSKLLVG